VRRSTVQLPLSTAPQLARPPRGVPVPIARTFALLEQAPNDPTLNSILTQLDYIKRFTAGRSRRSMSARALASGCGCSESSNPHRRMRSKTGRECVARSRRPSRLARRRDLPDDDDLPDFY